MPKAQFHKYPVSIQLNCVRMQLVSDFVCSKFVARVCSKTWHTKQSLTRIYYTIIHAIHISHTHLRYNIQANVHCIQNAHIVRYTVTTEVNNGFFRVQHGCCRRIRSVHSLDHTKYLARHSRFVVVHLANICAVPIDVQIKIMNGGIYLPSLIRSTSSTKNS